MIFQGFLPRFARQGRPLAVRLVARGLGTEREVPVFSPWRRRRHGLWADFFRDFPRPNMFRDVDDHFARTMQRFEREMSPRCWNTYDVRPRDIAEATARSEVAQVKYDKSVFEVKVDVSNYAPEELKVNLADNRLTLMAKHEKKTDEHGYVAREFRREFEVPEDVDLETLTSTLSEEGMLTLRADVKGAEKPETRTINIEREPKKN